MTCIEKDRHKLRRWQSPSKERSHSFRSVSEKAALTRQTSIGFPYLKVSERPAKVLPVLYVETVRPLPKKTSRLINFIFGAVGAMTVGLSLFLSTVEFNAAPTPAELENVSDEDIAADSLFEYLNSPEFKAFQQQYAQEKLEAELAAAEQLKLEASVLRDSAAADAEQTRLKAQQSATAMRLEASYDGVGPPFHRPVGFVISLNYPTIVEKTKTEFGYKVIATPTTEKGTVRVYINLASANEGFIPADGEIGKVGHYPVGEGIRAF